MATSDASPAPLPAGPEAPEAIAPRAAQLHALFALAWKGAGLLVAAMLTAIAAVLVLPDSNDYEPAIRLKHARLASLPARKIVLVGGSSLGDGIDSALIEQETGCPVANMGVSGRLGVRFMLDEVAPDIRRGDIVVTAFGYGSFFTSVDGAAIDQLRAAKAFPPLAARLSLRQQLGVLGAIPALAQQKILELMGEADAPGEVGAFEEVTPEGDLVTRRGGARRGDARRGGAWQGEREDGLDAMSSPVEPQAIGLIQTFAQQMRDRGADVIVSYAPVVDRDYDAHRQDLDDLHQHILGAPPLIAPSTPRDYALGENLFVNTAYRLNAEGRELRTRRLIGDLRRQLHERALCGPGPGLRPRGVRRVAE